MTSASKLCLCCKPFIEKFKIHPSPIEKKPLFPIRTLDQNIQLIILSYFDLFADIIPKFNIFRQWIPGLDNDYRNFRFSVRPIKEWNWHYYYVDFQPYMTSVYMAVHGSYSYVEALVTDPRDSRQIHPLIYQFLPYDYFNNVDKLAEQQICEQFPYFSMLYQSKYKDQLIHLYHRKFNYETQLTTKYEVEYDHKRKIIAPLDLHEYSADTKSNVFLPLYILLDFGNQVIVKNIKQLEIIDLECHSEVSEDHPDNTIACFCKSDNAVILFYFAADFLLMETKNMAKTIFMSEPVIGGGLKKFKPKIKQDIWPDFSTASKYPIHNIYLAY